MPQLCFTLCISLFFLLGNSQPKLSKTPTDLQEKVEYLMDKANIPGMSLAKIENGKLATHFALGICSKDTKEAVNEETIFAAASLSKPVFAYAVLQLVEEGKFDLDKPLYEYMTYEDLEHDDRYKEITARMVLSHTSGLPNWRRGKLNFQYEPNTKFRYSGEGFVFLMKVIEKLTGQSLDDFMQKRVFNPLKMDRTSYIWQKDFDSNYAIPHDDFGRTRTKYKPEEGNTAHSLQTTALDYSQFILAIMHHQGLQENSIKAMLQSQTEVEKAEHGLVNWGIGIGLGETKNGKTFWHWGDNGTFKCFIIANYEKKEGLVYFTNSSMGLSIADELLTHALGGDFPSLKWLDYADFRAPINILQRELLTKRFEEAVQPFWDQRKNNFDTKKLNEQQVNRLGYRLMQMREIQLAKRILALNVAAYPQSANVYDSYAEACLKNGDYPLAAENYSKAHSMDNKFAVAKKISDRLKGENEGSTVFQLSGYSAARHVSLAGEFNRFNKLDLPMIRENGVWVCRVDLEPGTYKYQFVVDGIPILDTGNEKSIYDRRTHLSVVVVE